MSFRGDPKAQKKESREQSSLISSRDNRWLKRFRACLGGEEGGDGIVGVEGVRLVEAALGSGLAVEALLVSASGERHLERLSSLIAPDLHMLRTTDRLFAGIADTRTPQGVAALVRPKIVKVEDLLRGVALVAVLVGVQDPGNVGTILRAAEAYGKSPVALLIGNEGAGLDEEIVRSCDARVSIPQRDSVKSSEVESLNAAMAGSVLLYEAMRQRGGI